MRHIKNSLSVLGIAISMAFGNTCFSVTAMESRLSDADFDIAKSQYFQRCAGCHGTLRKGGRGKNLEPKSTLRKGQKRLERIISLGTSGAMNHFDDFLSNKEIVNLATFLQMKPPTPPPMSLDQMRSFTKEFVAPKDYPDKPLHGLNWKNFFIVIERDAGKVAIIDGDNKKIVTHIDTGYGVNVIKGTKQHKTEHTKDIGRFWYTIGRDGKVGKIDLWQRPEKMLVAETKVAYDARDITVSGDGKYVIAGGYWPAHFVIMDAVTLNPLKVVPTHGFNSKGEFINDARVAAIFTSPNTASFFVAVKETGQVLQVDYKDLNKLPTTSIASSEFLDNGFFDPSGRYLQIATGSNKMVVIDTKDSLIEAIIDVSSLPHPGSGANWIDEKCGPVAGTTHQGVNLVSVWGNDPINYPENAWKLCYEVETDGAGADIRTHENSPYVWVDQVKHSKPEGQQSVQVLDKKSRKIVNSIRVTKESGKVALNMEFNRDGNEVWVSVLNRKEAKKSIGEVVVYDAKSLEEKARIEGLATPTDKFNVFNRSNY
jgi:nitrite reductase (NO-forming)/hydroxylamine reductase